MLASSADFLVTAKRVKITHSSCFKFSSFVFSQNWENLVCIERLYSTYNIFKVLSKSLSQGTIKTKP